MSLLSCPWSRQLSWDVPADAGLLFDKSTVLRNTIKCTHCMSYTYLPQYEVSLYTLLSSAYVCPISHAYSDYTFLPAYSNAGSVIECN
jgi:hypothetical protein